MKDNEEKLQVHIKINKLLKSRHNLSAEEKTKVVDMYLDSTLKRINLWRQASP